MSPQELQKANAKAASAKREAGAAAAQLAALEEQHGALLAGIEAHDAEVGEEIERLRAELADAQVAICFSCSPFRRGARSVTVDVWHSWIIVRQLRSGR